MLYSTFTWTHTHANTYTPPCFTTHTKDTHICTHTHTSPYHHPYTIHNSHNSNCQIHRSHWTPCNIGSLLCCDICLFAGITLNPEKSLILPIHAWKRSSQGLQHGARCTVDAPWINLEWLHSPWLLPWGMGQGLYLAVCADLLSNLPRGAPKTGLQRPQPKCLSIRWNILEWKWNTC